MVKTFVFYIIKSRSLVFYKMISLDNDFNKFSNNVCPLYPSQIFSIKTSFREKIAHLIFAKDIASFLIVEDATLATTYSDVCAAYMMYMTVSVTVATAERSFSKLKFKLIKTFFEVPCPKRLNGLALLSIENKRA